ncbi:glycosyltransferase family 1 protein [Pannus brasiliensis CCIBt3594]|uniref:Glycosyltransferase family 1 protein n=1 Tax=Pannus brasiliensis CCIBt3594 TaxID=1427578 RepID=A0AAW9QXS0_9CHRO
MKESHPLLINLSVIFSKPTGISTYILNILPYLKNLDPTLLTAIPRADFTCYPIPDDMAPDRGGKGHLKRLLWTQFQLPRIYRELNANLLFSPLPEAPLDAGCRFVVMVHDLIPLRFPSATSPLTYYFRYRVPGILQRAEHILCNSHATARDIIEVFKIPESKITPIPLAYDKEHFRPIEVPEPEIPYFLYLGRPNAYKNLDRLIEAFADLDRGSDHHLWIAGAFDRRYTPTLQRRARELGAGDRVKFLDYLSYADLPRVFNQATALVFPSLWEGFGLPVLEAMACGTPVITSNLSSLPEVAGDAAILVNPYRTEEITEAMRVMAGDGKTRSRLRDRGIERASAFSWEKTALATGEILNRYF